MPEFFIGLMSGTSLDGVDAALVDFSDPSGTLCATKFIPFPASLRKEALALNSQGDNEIHRAATLANDVAAIYAEAVCGILEDSQVPSTEIEAIGAHGQTVRHRPEIGYTVQLCNAALLAERTSIAVITDFRSRDIAAGGQGAPLVPAFHAACFRSTAAHRVILNIGGIANLTDLPTVGPVKGFDTGPGNLLLDLWCSTHRGMAFDAGGAWASSGECNASLLEQFLGEPFFRAAPPKSTGRDLFNQDWLAQFKPETHPPADVQATLAELSARSIADAIKTHCHSAQEVFVCGGGASNGYLLGRLSTHLPSLKVQSTQTLGLHPDWVEAVAFAWLARQTIARQPGNLPEVTGARGARILGAIYQ